jgi:cupin 2 domain-containing protein
MSILAGNLFTDVPAELAAEETTPLLAAPNVRIERIVSRGHASPPDFWYDQTEAEWVLVLAGSAAVLFEGEGEPRLLKHGDYLHIPAHARHRVVWTDLNEPTIWLAVHCR